MRNFYTYVFFILTIALSNGQTINFPDANLKAMLLEASPSNEIASILEENVAVDTNGNGEIEVSEALAITALHLYDGQISDLTGVEYFTNLTVLDAYNNQITNVALSSLTQLQRLLLYDNQLHSLDLATMPQLIELQFTGSSQFTHLDLSQSSELIVMEFSAPLTSMTIAGADNLIQIYAAGLQMQHLDLNACPTIEEVGLFNSAVESLDFSGTQCNTLLLGDCPNLEQLFMKNGVMTNIQQIDGDVELSFVCADENEIVDAVNALQYSAPNCVINSYCTFVPGGEYYTVSGSHTWDTNANGCDAQDPVFGNLFLTAAGSAGTSTWVSDTSGNFSVPVEAGSYVITPVLENPSDFTVTPASITVDFPADGDSVNQNFCVTPLGNNPDISICLGGLSAAIPGYDAEYNLIVRNTGNVALNGNLQFYYNEQTLDFVSTSNAIISQSPGLLVLEVLNFLPFETRYIDIVLNLNGPMETPPLNSDDILTYTISTSLTSGDQTITETRSFQQTVVNSFDPNDKTCLEGNSVGPEMAGEYVHYMIRFENTGTFPAQNIVVRDEIDTAQFDVSTLRPVGASHDFTTRINGNMVEFIFEDIDLPFDDANNDGWIIFRIKTLPTLTIGDTFENSASIFFDYNFPIVTEPAITTINFLSVSDVDFADNFTLYPNPADKVLNIHSISAQITSAEVYNMLGQLVLSVTGLQSIDVSALKTGNYLIRVHSAGGVSTSRFIKS